jgi:hypothetical protein
MKKKPKISFRHHDGSGPLSVHWYTPPFGDAEEAKTGDGVFWFSPSGDLLGVEFDDVVTKKDQQTLVSASGIAVTVKVVSEKATISVEKSEAA